MFSRPQTFLRMSISLTVASLISSISWAVILSEGVMSMIFTAYSCEVRLSTQRRTTLLTPLGARGQALHDTPFLVAPLLLLLNKRLMRSSNLEDKNCKHTRQLAHSRLELQYNFCSQSKVSPAVGLELAMISVLCKWTRSFVISQLFLVSWNIGDDVSTDQESEPRRMFAWSDACVFNLETKVFGSPPKKI